MKRALGFMYGVICYISFLFVFVRAIWFVWTMDTHSPQSSLSRALLINAILLGSFAVQHSGMARHGFKLAWTKLVPPLLERSTYVLMASLVLLTVVEFWQPLPGAIWTVRNAFAFTLLHALFWSGWLLLLTCTVLIDHFDLFGLKQAWKYGRSQTYEPPKFRTPGPYRFVRHPLYLGFIVAFWSAPQMTSSHLFFAIMCTGYILLAIQFEERDLVSFHGDAYRAYRSAVSMLVPLPGTKLSPTDESIQTNESSTMVESRGLPVDHC